MLRHNLSPLCLALLFVLTTTFHAVAQEPPGKKNTLALTQLKLFMVRNIGPEITYQRQVAARFSLQAKAAYIYGVKLDHPSQGCRLGAEAKFFFAGNFQKGGYAGLELDGFYNRYEGQWTVAEGSRYATTEHFFVNVRHAGLHVKAGYQLIHKWFFADVFAGVGARTVDVRYEGISDSMMAIMKTEGEASYPYVALYPLDGRYVALSIPLNVRAGIAF